MYRPIKRTLDIIISLIGLITLSPLLVVTALAIKVDSSGPVIFKQKRLGVNGKEFWIYKFRSMTLDAEKGGVYEVKGDPRITKVGKFIRKTSIDELPQFLNILKGEMSIIGPRPTLTYHPWKYDQYSEEQKKRFQVRPGVTGWAQVNGRKELDWNDRLKLDVEYVKGLSALFDIKIFFLTIYKVLMMKDNVNVSETAAAKKK